MGGATTLDCHTRISVLTDPFVSEIFIGAETRDLLTNISLNWTGNGILRSFSWLL